MIPALVAAAGIGLSAYGMYESNKAAAAAKRQARRAAQANAKLLRGRADEVQALGYERAQEEVVKAEAAVGAQKTQIAASGIMVDVGSAAAITDGTMLTAASNAAAIEINAAREARGLRDQADLVIASGQAQVETLANQNRANQIQGASNILGQAYQGYSGYRQEQQYRDPRT